MKKFSLSQSVVATALAMGPLLVQAADGMQNPAYLVDSAGAVVTNASGQCWRTGEWTPALATAPCDAMMTPAVVAQAPAPAPAQQPPAVMSPPPIILPLVPVQQRVSFSGDALFAFDKAVLRPESRALLDDLVRQLEGTRSDRISVTGHTDRIGSAKYNQKLSEQRASAVKDYLVGKNLQADRIEASGLGESQPMTEASACIGKKANARLIACLQPDRRVDVEMTGTKTMPAAQ
jgi:OOP family OmpA-OmpF porin